MDDSTDDDDKRQPDVPAERPNSSEHSAVAAGAKGHTPQQDRRSREAAALRENLKKRKARAVPRTRPSDTDPE